MLLGAAKLLVKNRDKLRRPVRLLFQPHEESYPGGAPDMIAGGALKGVGEIFGIHISSMLPTGQLGTRVGAFMAAVNTLTIRVLGRGGHAAMPNQCIDPIVTAAHIVAALQTVVSRSVAPSDPAVVSVTQFHAGTTHNVIPNDAYLNGTIRTFDEGVRQTVLTRVREVAENVARGCGATAQVELGPGYPVLVNDAVTTERALESARRIGFEGPRIQVLAQQGGAEDFAYYGKHVPASFVFLGAANEAKECTYPHHHPRFNVDEEALAQGAALHAQFAMDAGECRP
jgi:amidohydrolase